MFTLGHRHRWRHRARWRIGGAERTGSPAKWVTFWRSRTGIRAAAAVAAAFEQYASGKARVRAVDYRIRANQSSDVAGDRDSSDAKGRQNGLLADGSGETWTKLNGLMITAAARGGLTQSATDLMRSEDVRLLARQGLSDIAQILDPQVLVVGGGA